MSEPASDRPAFEPRLPHRFGDYELLAEIGRGGMGVIYQARQCCLDRLCAVKMLRPEYSSCRPDAEESLGAEAAAAARLDHPNIVGIYEVGREEGQLFFSMEFVDGEDLGRWVRSRLLDGPTIARLMRKIAAAIAYAHERGVMHHDLKPANVVMDSREEPQITDFGLARRVDEARRGDPSHGAGSPNYLSPEQASARFGEPGLATDVFGLGAILYFLLTDRPPFLGFTPEDTIRAVIETDPVRPGRIRPGISVDLETICLKCLEKEPSRRYASAREVAEELGRVLDDLPIRARPAGWMERSRRWCRRHPAVAALGSLVALLLVLIAAGSSAAAVRIHQARQRAEASELNTRHHLYNADLLLASAALAAGNDGRVREILHRHRPVDSQPDLRGWEWRFLDQASVGDVERIIGRHSNLVAQLTALPDARHVVAGDNGGTLAVWDVIEGRKVASTRLHEAGAALFTVAHDARQLITSARPAQAAHTVVRLLRLPGLEVETEFDAPGRQVPAGFGPGDTNVWLLGPDGCSCHALPGGQLLRQHPVSGSRHSRDFAVSPDGTRLALGQEDGSIRLWNLLDGSPVGRLPGHPFVPVWSQAIFTLEFAPDGRTLASTGTDGRVRLWDPAGLRSLGEIPGHADLVMAAAFSPDGSRIASAGKDSFVQIAGTDGKAAPIRLRGAEAMQSAICFFGPQRRVVSAGIDGLVRLWRDTPRSIVRWQTNLPPGTSAPVPLEDGVHFAAYLADAGLEVRRLDDARPLCRLEAGSNIVSTGFERTADGRSVAVTLTKDGALTLRIEPGGRLVEPRIEGPLAPRFRKSAQVQISPALHYVGISDLTEGLRVFETATGRLVVRHEGRTRQFTFSPSDTYLAATELGGSIRLWTLPDGKPGPTNLRHSQVSHAAFSPDERRLATVGFDGSALLWDPVTGRELTRLPSTADNLSVVAWSPDQTRLLGGTLGGTLCVWDLVTGREAFLRRGHTQPVIALVLRPDGDLLSFAPDGIQTWPGRPPVL